MNSTMKVMVTMTNNLNEKLQSYFNRKIKMPGVDISALQRRCTMHERAYIKELKSHRAEHVVMPVAPATYSTTGTKVYDRHTSSENPYYLYLDNHSDILAVAHLDTVLPEYRQRFKSTTNKAGQRVCISSELDDRLGAYIILDYLPKFGLKYDILLTTDEECGKSTAQYFKSDKDYKFIFEFDRAGTDLVMYDYHNDEMEDFMEEFFKIGEGSYTDICKLTHLKASAFNVGCGYQRPHSKECHVFLDDIQAMVRRFLGFWAKYSDTKLPFKLVTNRRYSAYDNWDNDDYDYAWGRAANVGTGGTWVKKGTGVVAFVPNKIGVPELAPKLMYCHITLLKFKTEDITVQQLDDFVFVQFHKAFLTRDLKNDDGFISSEKYYQLWDWFSQLPQTDQHRFVREFIMANFDELPGPGETDSSTDLRDWGDEDDDIDDEDKLIFGIKNSKKKADELDDKERANRLTRNLLMLEAPKTSASDNLIMPFRDKNDSSSTVRTLCDVCNKWFDEELYREDDDQGICYDCVNRLNHNGMLARLQKETKTPSVDVDDEGGAG